MSKRYDYVQSAKVYGKPFTQVLLAAACEAGVLDDLTAVGIADNGIVAVTLTILEGFILRAQFTGSASLGRTFVKSILTIGTGAMMVDDATVAGIADNPIAMVTGFILAVMSVNDWRRSR